MTMDIDPGWGDDGEESLPESRTPELSYEPSFSRLGQSEKVEPPSSRFEQRVIDVALTLEEKLKLLLLGNNSPSPDAFQTMASRESTSVLPSSGITHPTYDMSVDASNVVAISPGRESSALTTSNAIGQFQASPEYNIHYDRPSSLSPLSAFHTPSLFPSSGTPAYYLASRFGTPTSILSASTPASYLSARSAFSTPAFNPLIEHMHEHGYSRRVIGTIKEEEPVHSSPVSAIAKISVDYHSNLSQRGLILPKDQELNWSGKGQHVEFTPMEYIPLEIISHLGASRTALVDKVWCRRILLARKMTRCSGTSWKFSDALREVEHLQRLKHFHIIQLVGSYLQGRTFAILMYPAADCHLGTFLEDTADIIPTLLDPNDENWERTGFLHSSLSCLSSAVEYIHANSTKHMDIKPANILIRRVPLQNRLVDERMWRVYLADFGLSRSFAPQDHSQTDGKTARTPKYCAPEVYNYETRGRSADIFSLGCVFLEIETVIRGFHVHDFTNYRCGDDGSDESFHQNLTKVFSWIDTRLDRTFDQKNWFGLIRRMISYQPSQRPTAADVVAYFGSDSRTKQCCQQHPEPYVASTLERPAIPMDHGLPRRI